MPKFVAFLRAINVGGHVVKMDALRAHFETIGLAGVETFIASGNVAFTASSRTPGTLERKIEAHLLAKLGYEVATFLRTPEELAALLAARPFPAAEMSSAANTLHVGFLREAPASAAVKKLAELAGSEDRFRVAGREAYWLRRGRMSDSKFSGAVLEKTLGMPATLRNMNTVRTIVEKLGSSTRRRP